MKKLLLIALFFGATNLFAQQQQDSILENKVSKLEAQVSKQEQDIKQISLELDKDYWTYRGVKKETQEKITQQKNTIDSLNLLIDASNQKLVKVSDKLDSKIQKTDDTVSSNNSKITQLDSSLSKNQLYWIIATLIILFMGGLIYWLLAKRIQSSKTDVETQIKNTKTALEEESVKLDSQLVEVLSKQLEIIKLDQTKSTTASNENDHSLVLKVADRLNSMEKNLSRMDQNVKGLKNLKVAVKNIKDNFAANGYEIVEMLGKEYKQGIKAIANFIPNEEVEAGKEIISRIIKPQVNFKGEMIQAAQIEVSVGE